MQGVRISFSVSISTWGKCRVLVLVLALVSAHEDSSKGGAAETGCCALYDVEC